MAEKGWKLAAMERACAEKYESAPSAAQMQWPMVPQPPMQPCHRLEIVALWRGALAIIRAHRPN